MLKGRINGTRIEITVRFTNHTMDCDNECGGCTKLLFPGDKAVIATEEIEGKEWEPPEPYCNENCFKAGTPGVDWHQ